MQGSDPSAPAPVPAPSKEKSKLQHCSRTDSWRGQGQVRSHCLPLHARMGRLQQSRAGSGTCHGLPTLPRAPCGLDAAYGAALWGRERRRPVLPMHLLTLFSSLGLHRPWTAPLLLTPALCVTQGPAPAPWHGQSPPSAPRVSLWDDRPAKKIESPFL